MHETAQNTAVGEGNTSDDEEYTLPFKVLGSVHHKNYNQNLLMTITAMPFQLRSTGAKVLRLLAILCER